MRRTPPFLAAVALAALLTACGDTRTVTSPARQVPRALENQVAPTALEQAIEATIAGMYDHGFATSVSSRWSTIRAKYSAGQSAPSQLAVAKQMLVELTSWIQQHVSGEATPPGGQTRAAAAAQLVIYMSTYIYGDQGPNSLVPPAPGPDAAIGVVTPTTSATIVTPMQIAGVRVDAGSVTQTTIIVVSQNPTVYFKKCSGPLVTSLCQYPNFYKFDEFPHLPLTTPAHFQVCHVNTGTFRNPVPEHHANLLIAHDKPADGVYTPGSTVEEGIEILPFTHQSFLPVCPETSYPPSDLSPGFNRIGALLHRGRTVLGALASAAANLFLPRNAYAIDQGGGGDGLTFSSFNVVDTSGAGALANGQLPIEVPPGYSRSH